MTWQPIETADKADEGDDDIWILACRRGSKLPMVTTWDHDRQRWYTFNLALEWSRRGRNPADWKWDPTHWMPLPKPPQ